MKGCHSHGCEAGPNKRTGSSLSRTPCLSAQFGNTAAALVSGVLLPPLLPPPTNSSSAQTAHPNWAPPAPCCSPSPCQPTLLTPCSITIQSKVNFFIHRGALLSWIIHPAGCNSRNTCCRCCDSCCGLRATLSCSPSLGHAVQQLLHVLLHPLLQAMLLLLLLLLRSALAPPCCPRRTKHGLHTTQLQPLLAWQALGRPQPMRQGDGLAAVPSRHQWRGMGWAQCTALAKAHAQLLGGL